MGCAETPTINAQLARRLIADQFPQWADLPVVAVTPGGWDNRTFRLGDDLSVRLPSAARYAPQVAKEHRWLPVLATQLPLPIAQPVAKGRPGAGYPWPWSVYRWVPGDVASRDRIDDLPRFAAHLGGFLRRIHAIETLGGPVAGAHSFHRGGSLSVYDEETRRSIDALTGAIDADWANRMWDTALRSGWDRSPVWVHGDIAASNLLLQQGRLSAVIDFGCMAVGDPACDLVIAWTFFGGESRSAFRAALPDLDDACWLRARGWALWKAVITLADTQTDNPAAKRAARRTLVALAADDQ